MSSLFSDSATGSAPDSATAAVSPDGSRTVVLPVIEESLIVDKRRVDQGGWRVNKQVTTREETVDEPLRFEQVSVERREIGQVLASMEPPAPRQEGDTWILPVVEEVLVTEKRLLLKEEIRITRVASIRHEPQQVSLRSEEVSIERLEPGHSPDIASP